MWRMAVLLALATMLNAQSRPTTLKADLVFLTRDGCVNTPDMVVNLDDALTAMELPTDYQYLNIEKLSKTDARTGYPTPTVLYRGKDIFGMPKPTPPFPEPS